MDDTQETEIIKLLYNYKNDDKITNLPDYPLTDSNIVNTISKSITDIIYNSYKNKSVASRNTRDTVIGLLSKWIEPSSHIRIDETNYEIFIKCLDKELQPTNSFYQKYGHDFVKVSRDTSKVERKSEWENICETLNKKYMTHLENKIKSGLIQTWNKNQFEKVSFDYNGPNKTFQNLDTENFLEYLKSLHCEPQIIEDTNMDIIETNIFEPIINLNISEKESNIQLGYSLITFEQKSETERLLLKILENISLSRTEAGIRFIEHIWRNSDNLKLSPKIYVKTLEKFQHLYEKPIVTLATEILENLDVKSDMYEYEVIIENAGIKNILEMCDFDLEISNNVILVLNQLLALSKFDVRIFKTINIIRNIFTINK